MPMLASTIATRFLLQMFIGGYYLAYAICAATGPTYRVSAGRLVKRDCPKWAASRTMSRTMMSSTLTMTGPHFALGSSHTLYVLDAVTNVVNVNSTAVLRSGPEPASLIVR